MSYLSRPTDAFSNVFRTAARAVSLAAAFAVVALPTALSGQQNWTTTADDFDAAAVVSHLDHVREQLAERHGPLAEALWSMNERLAGMPSFLSSVTPPSMASAPSPEPLRLGVEAAHLMHHQATGDGSLGVLHGSSGHPGVEGWFPHSMFAQGGKSFSRWGHARLLAAVDGLATRRQN